MNENYHSLSSVMIADSISNIIKYTGIEGVEDLVNSVLTHKDLRQLKEAYLEELYRIYPFLRKK